MYKRKKAMFESCFKPPNHQDNIDLGVLVAFGLDTYV